ncbi:hypothetical protein [Streptomyces sp. NBC_00094]|uniref:hypothetical protein n=1 Tax=Streptomyces sp. NBC_00094 TaxID=2903620 RepID=UPI002258BEAD|nr:hypothetical protein [Streptomyces sp. NBC_00094]MCX5392103.1 Uma2 family endonuclease [Streptomyces sp. NBC_00094]
MAMALPAPEDAFSEGMPGREGASVQEIRAYARAGIPVHLLIDRGAGEAVVCSEPVGDAYAHKFIHTLGTVVPLPYPLGFELDTSAF